LESNVYCGLVKDVMPAEIKLTIYTVRRYASAVYADIVHLCLCLSVWHTLVLYQNG